MVTRYSSSLGLFVGDGKKIFHVDKNGSVFDKSFYLDGSSGLDFLHIGVLNDHKILWLDKKYLLSQKYGEKLYVETTFKINDKKIKILDYVVNDVFVRKIISSKPIRIFS